MHEGGLTVYTNQHMCAVCTLFTGISQDNLAGINTTAACACAGRLLTTALLPMSAADTQPPLASAICLSLPWNKGRSAQACATATQDLAAGPQPLIWAVLTRGSAHVRRLQKLPRSPEMACQEPSVCVGNMETVCCCSSKCAMFACCVLNKVPTLPQPTIRVTFVCLCCLVWSAGPLACLHSHSVLLERLPATCILVWDVPVSYAVGLFQPRFSMFAAVVGTSSLAAFHTALQSLLLCSCA